MERTHYNIDGVNWAVEIFTTDFTTVAEFVSYYSGKMPKYNDEKLKEVYKFVTNELKGKK
jgi:hypothetical protein